MTAVEVSHRQGALIAFEGPDGCGKSTQAERVAERLGARFTREPGGTEVGQLIRGALLAGANDHDVSDRCEALLMAADRSQHIYEVVLPELMSGRYVVTDRSLFSSIAYQVYGRKLFMDDVVALSNWALTGTLSTERNGLLWPDLVVLIVVEEEELRRRRAAKQDAADRIEMEDSTFHRNVRLGYLHMASEDPTRWITVDGSQPIDELTETIIRALELRGIR